MTEDDIKNARSSVGSLMIKQNLISMHLRRASDELAAALREASRKPPADDHGRDQAVQGVDGAA
jgi:hypothetical protein